MNYLVDQNYLRTPDLQELTNIESNNFYLFDSALMEMIKSVPNWESTIRNSLKILSKIPNRAFFIMSVGEARNLEKNNHIPISRKELIRSDYNEFFRGLLKEVRDDDYGDSFALLESSLQKGIEHFEIFQNQKNKDALGQFIDAIKKSDPDLSKSLRKGKISEQDQICRIKEITHTSFSKFFIALGFNQNEIIPFVNLNPINARYLYTNLLLAFSWISEQGFENIKKEKVTNELCDTEYIILGSYFDGGMLSKDNKANKIFCGLKLLLHNSLL